ncbi:MAG: sulfite exporter TauE/SafE family protein [Winogradskyella sp.]|uniref:sulfite exporter TauE/SafE family protein n=1 Tax=Winogradskyella sp. TaxID=1883156 RepID=UPI001799B77A|nr:sulfite exporter TauE/SafE family protein [Winogradskyella sp.]MBT8245385.1 sulfite exporter TauE/SafE family protein [Winogradskyella sp.]NNK23612.1 sulfite exporter TauE/SafE family protein [Winogradskyella sp.]
METNEILGYLASVIAGIIMGLIGGGGSILSVPILVYLLGFNPIVGTAYSLFVVGATSTVGAFQSLRQGLVDLKAALIFAIPSIIGVYLTRRYVVPILPDIMFTVGDFKVTSGIFIMIVFAIVMLMASYSMISDKRRLINDTDQTIDYNAVTVFILGLLTGTISGFVGAGGGFLNIPVLVLFVKLPMKKAIGTSLFIISMKSLIGFLGDLKTIDIDWNFLLSFTVLSIIGIILGLYFSKFIDEKKLKKGFGYFTLIMGGYIIWKEIF